MSRREDTLTITGAGDAIIARRLRTFDHPGLTRLVELVRGTDAAMVNLEILLHEYEGYPTGSKTGTYMRAPPWVADELDWAGFNLYAAATNHAYDYSHGGMLATIRELDARELTHAGLGENLAHARAPGYADTEAGRVALVSACASITAGSIAGEQRPDMHGRPGINPLRTTTRYVVPDDAYDQIRALTEDLDLESLKAEGAQSSFPYLYPSDPDEGFTLPNVDGGDLVFARGEEYRIEQTMDEDDLAAITAQIEDATKQADWVVASLHAHHGPKGRSNVNESAAFTEEFARACIDAGADVFFGHGPHVPHGIELYDGKPLFHSLGNFVFQNQLVTRFPQEIYDRYNIDDPGATPPDVFHAREYDADGNPKGFLANQYYWESFLPICEFDDGHLTSLTVYPLDLLQDEPRSRRGRPVVATGARADEILDHLANLSDAYDTTIDIADGIATIAP